MISKELLSEILDKKVVVDDISNIELKENTITFIEDYWDEDEGSGFYRSHTINIYELAHKCKMWAHSNGYMLNTVILTADNKTWYCEDDYNKTRTTWKDDSEVLVIFKAAQWILDNVKTNSLS